MKLSLMVVTWAAAQLVSCAPADEPDLATIYARNALVKHAYTRAEFTVQDKDQKGAIVGSHEIGVAGDWIRVATKIPPTYTQVRCAGKQANFKAIRREDGAPFSLQDIETRALSFHPAEDLALQSTIIPVAYPWGPFGNELKRFFEVVFEAPAITVVQRDGVRVVRLAAPLRGKGVLGETGNIKVDLRPDLGWVVDRIRSEWEWRFPAQPPAGRNRSGNRQFDLFYEGTLAGDIGKLARARCTSFDASGKVEDWNDYEIKAMRLVELPESYFTPQAIGIEFAGLSTQTSRWFIFLYGLLTLAAGAALLWLRRYWARRRRATSGA